jgi:hypothetical protein
MVSAEFSVQMPDHGLGALLQHGPQNLLLREGAADIGAEFSHPNSFSERYLGTLPFGDTYNRSYYRLFAVQLDGIEADFNREFTAVFAYPEEISAGADGPDLGTAHKIRA